MLHSLHIRGYRSLRDFRLKLGRVTVVTGGNGVGKSNLYRALGLVQRMAEGRFAEAVENEGGMPSLLWAGDRRKDEPKRVGWELEHADFHFSIECGLSPANTDVHFPSAFQTDPDIKKETLSFGGTKGRIMARRKGPVVDVRGESGKMETQPLPLHAPESMLAEIRDGIRFPTLTAAREVFASWRFYHQFRTDADSPLRRPRIGSWSPVLAHDGSNLAATLRTIQETGGRHILEEAVAEAFPETEWRTHDESGFQLSLRGEDLDRWLGAAELSDGTLRFFCLCAALLSPKPPPLLVINEPETSLHPQLLGPLAELIARLPPETQLILVTHSQELAAAVSGSCEAKVVPLISSKGETRRKGEDGPNRVWIFEEED